MKLAADETGAVIGDQGCWCTVCGKDRFDCFDEGVATEVRELA